MGKWCYVAYRVGQVHVPGRVRRQRRRRVGCGRLTGYLAPADKAQEGQSSDDRDTKEKEVEDDVMQRMAKVQHEGSETLAKAVENRLGQGPQDIEAEVDENTPLSNNRFRAATSRKFWKI